MSTTLRPQPLGPRDFALIVFMNIMWGTNIVAMKMTIDLMSPLTAALLRIVCVALICLPALRLVPGQMWRLLVLGVVNGGLALAAFNLALIFAKNVSALAIATQLGVPFSILLAVLFLRERIHWRRLIGIALAISGVILLVFDPSAGGQPFALFLAALAAFFWALGMTVMRGMPDIAIPNLYAWTGLIGSLVLAPVCLIFEPEALSSIHRAHFAAFGWILFSAVGSTLLGHGAMSWLVQRHPLSTISPLTLPAPVIAVAVSSLVFGTPITALMIAGGTIAFAGVAIITIRSGNELRATEM